MADIFREVDEDLRHERFLKLWRRFRYYLIGGLVAIIGAVIAYVVVTDLKESSRQAEGERFAAAADTLNNQQFSAAVEQFEALAADSSSGYVALAGLRTADALLASGDVDGAVAVYDRIAGDSRVDTLYRELATLLAAQQLVDRASVEEINQRLAGLITEESVWRALASELRAVAELRAGNREAARGLFAELAVDQRTPRGVRARARALLDSLGGPPAGSDASGP